MRNSWSPKAQAYVERFNWTLQDECLYYHLDKILEDPKLLDQAVTDWLTWYNTKRPHQALNYQTPQQVLNYQLLKTERQKSQMYVTRTITCQSSAWLIG